MSLPFASDLPAPPIPSPHLPLPPAYPGRTRTHRLLRLLVIIGALVVLTAAAIVLGLVLLASSGGVPGLAIAFVLAIVPMLLVVAAFLWLDRFEPEPPPLLLALFAWGAIVAALAAGIINTVTQTVIAAAQGGDGAAATAVLVAPVVEEIAKGVGILVVLLLHRREFDGVLDGVVSAGFVAVGFAFTENILYFGQAYLQGESGELGVNGAAAAGMTFVLRGLVSPFAHPLFTVMTGIGIGLAVSNRRLGAVRWLAPVVGLIAAIFLHGLWNFSTTLGFGGFATSYVVFMVPAFFITVGLAVWLRRREGQLLARRLPEYVRAGWIPPHDVDMVASLKGRAQARKWARGRMGAGGLRAMQNYQEAAAELAFLRDRAGRLGVDRDFSAREVVLLSALARSRAELAPAFGTPGPVAFAPGRGA